MPVEENKINNKKYFDVTIRCYILGGCISSVMEEIEDDFNNWLEEKEAEENEEE